MFFNYILLLIGLLFVNYGIINNCFYDKVCYDYYKMGKGYEDSMWIKVMFMWNLVEIYGLKVVMFFWFEFDVCIGGQFFIYYFYYFKYVDY